MLTVESWEDTVPNHPALIGDITTFTPETIPPVTPPIPDGTPPLSKEIGWRLFGGAG